MGGAYGIAFAIAGAAPTACMVIHAAVPVLYFIVITFARSADGDSGSVVLETTRPAVVGLRPL